MITPKYDSGDYVKWKEKSKSGKEYYDRGMVTDVDTRLSELNMFGDSEGYIRYDILREDGEETTKWQKELEPDIQGERESTLNNFFDEDGD